MTYQQTIMEERMFAMEEGEKKGIKKGIEKVAIEMLKNNIPVEMISKVTKMAVEQINALKSAL